MASLQLVTAAQPLLKIRQPCIQFIERLLPQVGVGRWIVVEQLLQELNLS